MNRLLAIPAVLLAAGPTLAQGDRLPADLALVPQDGLGFVHVRVADLWGHESLKDVRDILKKAGDKAIAALDERFAGLPSNVERLTMWVGPTRSKYGIDSDYLFVVRLARPADPARLRKLLAPEAIEKKGKRFTWYAEPFGASLLIADDRTFAIGPRADIARLADGTPSKSAPLRDGLLVAAGDRPLVVGVNVPALPTYWLKELQDVTPAPLRPLLGVRTATTSLDLAGEGHLHVRLDYPTTAAAEAIERLLKAPDGPTRKLIDETRKELQELVVGDEKEVGLTRVPIAAAAVLGLGVLKQVEEALASDKLRRSGMAVEVAVELPTRSKAVIVPAAFAVGAGIGGLASQSRKEIDARQTNDLKQLILGLHNYTDVNNQAVAAITDADGKPLLSWRVALLPYIEQDNIYKFMKLDEPWDSEHNKKFIEQMPKIFEIDGVTAKKGYTHYRTFVGTNAAWALDRPFNFASVKDGLSNTVIFVQAADPVIWTKPDELPFDGKQAVKPRLLFRDGRTVIGVADGSVKILRDTIDEDVWKLLIDANDGKPIPDGILK